MWMIQSMLQERHRPAWEWFCNDFIISRLLLLLLLLKTSAFFLQIWTVWQTASFACVVTTAIIAVAITTITVAVVVVIVVGSCGLAGSINLH